MSAWLIASDLLKADANDVPALGYDQIWQGAAKVFVFTFN